MCDIGMIWCWSFIDTAHGCQSCTNKEMQISLQLKCASSGKKPTISSIILVCVSCFFFFSVILLPVAIILQSNWEECIRVQYHNLSSHFAAHSNASDSLSWFNHLCPICLFPLVFLSYSHGSVDNRYRPYFQCIIYFRFG